MPPALKSLDLVIAVVFLTIAIPLKTHGRWLTIGWLVEGAALLWLTRIVPQRLLRVLALLALVLGLAALLLINPPASTTIVFNQRFATYLAGIAVFAFTAIIAAHSARMKTQSFPHLLANHRRPVRPHRERTHPHRHRPGNSQLLVDPPLRIRRLHHLSTTTSMYAQFTYSAFFMLFGAILLLLGFVQRSAFLRWQALVLLAVSIGKVFLIDVSQLSQGYRILSFLGLGALLLGVSFVYQRDWLNLRGEEQHSQ